MRAEAQLLVDLSVLAGQDDHSGIQRVVRGVLRELQRAPPPGWRIEPVYDAGGHYAYARRFGASAADDDTPIRVAAGDLFFGLDLCPNQVPANAAVLQDLRRHGVQLYFMVYDLLPITHAEMFVAGARPWFSHWLRTVAGMADGLVCISRAVADELTAWLEDEGIRRPDALQIAYCHLGADLPPAAADETADAPGLTDQADPALLAALAARPCLLMVGTLEPRKMHGQALDAMELLWQRGVDAALVIVGKPGWKMGLLGRRLREHPEAGRRLFWLDHAGDALLTRLYGGASALLAASVAEGFGLPLIEAARHALPVIARDIPVFREVGGEHCWYFQADGSQALAAALQAWLALSAAGRAPASAAMPYLSWADSTAQIVACLQGRRRYRVAPTWLA
jgi:glycosyltransferase involved in cell wall biosynthesis